MAASVDGRYLYPVVEGAYADEPDPRRREIHEFDTRAGAYTGRTWSYQTDQEPNVGDAFTVRNGVLLLADAHAAGLTVHGWTFRAENQFLPVDFRVGTDPNAYGDLAGEVVFGAAG